MGLAIAQTIMATIVLSGCTVDNDSTSESPTPTICPVEPPSTLELTQDEKELVNHCNEFAFNLFRRAQDGLNSQILSPISITYALGMLNNGADGKTREQINEVLGFGDTGADGINDFCYKMLNYAPIADPLTKVLMADNIYMNKDFVLKDDFVNLAKVFYNADVETRDFNDGRTMDVINQWASDHTEKMIEKVLDENTFNPYAVSYLLNAIYFKGIWTYKFDKAMTTSETFIHAGDSKEMTTCQMMSQTADFYYAEDNDYQALRLPYGNGAFQMTVLLPKTVSNALPAVPTAEQWQQLNERMGSTLVDVKLPRFKTDTDINLVEIMTQLGMPDAFDAKKADFSNFCNVPTHIELMKQVAKIKVDEEGTEAAAVTVIGLEWSSATPSPVSFRADHPFLYVISELKSGAIFFIGQYTGY